MSLIPRTELQKDPQVILKGYKTELQKLLLTQYLNFVLNYTGRFNFSCGNSRFFMDLYSDKHWFSISDIDLIIIEIKSGTEIARFSTPGVSKDEYFNLIVSDDGYPDIIRSENIDKLVKYVQNVVIPVVNTSYDHFS